MARPYRGRAVTAALAAVLLLAAHSTPAAITLTWPGAAPCNATLQACINAASSGDTVEIATNTPIRESISFQKSLALQAAPGFHPLFQATRTITAMTPAVGSNSITIAGLTLLNGVITVTQSSGAPLTAAILGNTIELSLATSPAIAINGSGSGAISLDISNNTLTVPASTQNTATGIAIQEFDADKSGRIADNTIVMEGSPSAILVQNTTSAANLDVIGNRISGSYGDGISFVQFGAGITAVRILGNLAIGQTGGPRAIFLDDSSGGGGLTATVVNNTVAGGAFGILTSGGNLSGLIANNIVSGMSAEGLGIGPSVTATVANRNNLVFGNGSDMFTPGPGTVFGDPLFIDPSHGNYHLKPGSPAIDAGDDGAVPSDLAADLDGNPRIQGTHVDLGAFEGPGPSAAGAPRAFTGEMRIEIGGSQLHPRIYAHGNAVLNTGVAPPSFTIPAGAFVAETAFLSFLPPPTATTASGRPAISSRQLVSLMAQNAQGSFAPQTKVGRMPWFGLLRLQRLGFPIVGTAMGSIDAGFIGAPGKRAATFMYQEISTVMIPTTSSGVSGTSTRQTTANLTGTAMLTGQSFAVTKDSRTPAGGGHIQLVAPFSFKSSLSTWDPSSSVILALDFAPEPDRAVGGAAAVTILVAAGLVKRRRLAQNDSRI